MRAAHQRKRMAKNSILIWVDANAESDDSDTVNAHKKLREITNDVKFITTLEECITVLNVMTHVNCYVITPGYIGQQLIPKIHPLDHLRSIFILCRKKENHKKLRGKWSKIREIYTSIDSICEELSQNFHEVHNDDIAMSIITSENDTETDPKQLPPSFMYSSMLKDIFLCMQFTQWHFNKMIQKLLSNYKENKKETRLINEFAKEYRLEKVVWWYTRQCFTYTDVNRSLRTLDADMIVDMAPFIVDLHKQIQQLHEQQLDTIEKESFTVYRGQGMTREAFCKLNQSKNGLLSFDCFLSTSKQRETSIQFAEGGATRENHVGVIFVISIEPSIRAVPFAHIKEHSYYPDEDEILFSMHSIFKIGAIEQLSGHTNIFEAKLQLTNEDDPKLLALKKHMSGEARGIPEHRLGCTLNDMGEYDKAREIYLALLESDTNERRKGAWNHQLGIIEDRQGRYHEAIAYYEKTIDIETRLAPEGDPNIATTYGQLASAHKSIGNYSEALVHYEKSLQIRKDILPENHPSLATSYNNIGLVYDNMGEYDKALKYFEKSHEIYKKTLPENHPSLATSYSNIGSVYENMGDYQKSLEYFEKSLEIYKKSLPENHPNIAANYNKIGVLFYNMKKYKQALQYLELARRIFMTSLPPTHPSIKTTNDLIELVKKDME